MADEKTIIMPDGQNNNGLGNLWPLAFMNGGWNNGFFGNGGFMGSGFGAFLGGLFGSALPGFFNGGFGGGFGGNGAGAAAALGAQATANNNAETILRAIDGTDSDVRLLATTLNSDVNTVKTNLATLQNGLTMLTGQTGLSAQQIINSIQAGNAALAQQLCQCCCQMQQQVAAQGYENQLATLNQTNTLGTAINGSGQRTVDAIADLKTTMVKEFCDAKERDMQSEINRQAEIITQLRNVADNAQQTSAIAAMIAPIAREVDDIKCKLPNTVSVTYPNLYAVNATPYVSGGYYQGGYNGVYGFPGIGGFGGGINF
ncbi:MAG: hypothetical protein IJP77_06245 [Bacteroidales bacterium]|nr:hypothetical protein [Bacteroidales bacterium]